MRYQINTGTAHPLAKGLGKSLSSMKRATGSVTLVGFDDLSLWYGNISVGIPAVTFTSES